MKRLRLNSNESTAFLDEIKKLMEESSITEFEVPKKFTQSYLRTLAETDTEKPTLFITADAYITMLELVRQSSLEISWHGLVDKMSKSEYLLYDILVFPQINSATTTQTDETDFAEWQTNLILDEDFPIEHLRMHGHSHVNMNVFSSAVDDQYQKDILTKVDDGDYYLFLVLNKKMEMCILLYDLEQQILFETEDVEVVLLSQGENAVDLRDNVRIEIEANCAVKTITTKSKKPGTIVKSKSDLAIDEDDFARDIEPAWYSRFY